MQVQRPDPAECVFALAVLALGLYVLVGAFGIDLGSGYDRIGPRFFPVLVAAGLLLTGGFMLAGSVFGRSRRGPEPMDWRALGLAVLALGLSVLLLQRLGFILTVSLLFWLIARAFNSRRPGRDALAGIVLAVTVYLAFTRGLGLVLPAGILPA